MVQHRIDQGGHRVRQRGRCVAYDIDSIIEPAPLRRAVARSSHDIGCALTRGGQLVTCTAEDIAGLSALRLAGVVERDRWSEQGLLDGLLMPRTGVVRRGFTLIPQRDRFERLLLRPTERFRVLFQGIRRIVERVAGLEPLGRLSIEGRTRSVRGLARPALRGVDALETAPASWSESP
ncbi:hypothetical protein LCD36_06860 [Saccharopolyspora sp. 6T]|nr:hypothetical protein [Saccharopolyspora sp. 6T]MCA1186165.1 hypothetical protein [Saccharopolyspora sp. 6T]